MNYFDRVAGTYNDYFANTLVGRAQRKRVHYFLDKFVRGSRNLNILELNCGTGIDAIHLAAMGHRVLATDKSAEMITQCTIDSQKINAGVKPEFRQLSIQQLDRIGDQKFDIIFSDFAGFNCLKPDELVMAMKQLHRLLNNEGKLIVVLFGTQCLTEKLYFLLKGNFRAMNRRSSNMSKFGTEALYYYGYKKLCTLVNSLFRPNGNMAVGVFVPPSYMDNWAKRNFMLFRFLEKMEKIAANLLPPDKGDHYIAAFEKIN